MRTTTILTSLLVLVPSAVFAEGDVSVKQPELYDFIASPPTPSHISFVRQMLPPTEPNVIAAVAQSRVIYLNKNGVTLSPGNNDSRTNRSTLVNSTVAVPPWNASATLWQGVKTCFEDMFSRWDVEITDVDPGNVPHIEAVFTTSPSVIGMQSGVGGVSPFTQNCGVIENSVVFTFASVFPQNAQTICEVMAQEVAHSYGLDHEMLASDPMTYLSYNGKRTFKDQTVSCGEYQNRSCGIGGSVCRPNQNSVQLLNERLGLADLVAPTVGITAPQDGATVEPGFDVQATASDNIGVTAATLSIDGVMVATTNGGGPYTFPTDATLPDGQHTITVEATDGKNTQSQTIHINVQTAGMGSGSDTGSGSDDGMGGGGTGSGSDTDGDGDVDQDDGGGVTGGGSQGGCSTGGGDVGFAFGLFFLAHMMIRRRRYI